MRAVVSGSAPPTRASTSSIPASGRIEHLRHDPQDPDSLVDDRITTLALDHAGALWVGTEAGLERWQPERARSAIFITRPPMLTR